MRHEDIDLSEMVESAALEFDAVAFERGCLLESEVDEGIHVRATPSGWSAWCAFSSTTPASTAQGNHRYRPPREKHTAASRVHNVGNPIDPEDLPHVFERFYRSDKARTREGEGGFGLGLAIAKGIVDAHGGTISVTSSEQDGTTFTVTL